MSEVRHHDYMPSNEHDSACYTKLVCRKCLTVVYASGPINDEVIARHNAMGVCAGKEQEDDHGGK